MHGLLQWCRADRGAKLTYILYRTYRSGRPQGWRARAASGPARAGAALLLALALAPAATAQTPMPELRLPEALDQNFRALMEQMKPALDTLKLLGDIDGVQNYAAPEMLPNGDILIRRLPEAPALVPDPPLPPAPPVPQLRT